MSSPAPASVTFYRPAEVARMLRCSQWWVTEQARRRRIPFCWIGGGYRFTPEHVAEIARLFEVRPTTPAPPAAASSGMPQPRRRPAEDNATAEVVRLRARTPRRARSTAPAPNSSAA